MTSERSALETVLLLEREMQTYAARSDPARMAELLDPDFVEVGASGRRWDRDAILAMLAEESTDPGVEIAVEGLHGRMLTPVVAQAFWDSDRDGRRARRSSVWRLTEGGWRLVHHQGTVLP